MKHKFEIKYMKYKFEIKLEHEIINVQMKTF